MVENKTVNREVLDSIPTLNAALCPWARHINSTDYCLIPKKRWSRPDITAKLLTGTFNLNPNKT